MVFEEAAERTIERRFADFGLKFHYASPDRKFIFTEGIDVVQAPGYVTPIEYNGDPQVLGCRFGFLFPVEITRLTRVSHAEQLELIVENAVIKLLECVRVIYNALPRELPA